MKKQGMVWISTILYTLISLAVIGLLLAVVQPKITQIKDSMVIEQTKTSMSKVDETMLNVKEGAAGMKLYSEFKLGKGSLIISGKNDSIRWTYQPSYEYSQAGRKIQSGDILMLTEKAGNGYNLTLSMNYDFNLTVDGSDKDKIIQAASLSYKLWLTNKGTGIDITVE